MRTGRSAKRTYMMWMEFVSLYPSGTVPVKEEKTGMINMEQTISCPKCGMRLLKARQIDQSCICPRCNKESYVYSDGRGFTMFIEPYQMKEERFRERLQAFILEIERNEEGYFDIMAEANHVKAFGSILAITEKGNTAEVKRAGDGSLKVYEVEKRVTCVEI